MSNKYEEGGEILCFARNAERRIQMKLFFCAGCGAEQPKIAVPQGQPVYQQPVKAPRKPMPMRAKIAIVAVAALIVLVTAGSLILSSLASPKRQAE